MHIYSVLGPEELDTIANVQGIRTVELRDLGPAPQRGRYAGKRHVALMLRPVTDYKRRFKGERRVSAVTWEAHRDYMREIFARDPSATIDTVSARYRGADEFERLHAFTSRDPFGRSYGKVTAETPYGRGY
jgi:hypothetical protein